MNDEIIGVMKFWDEITMFVSECMFPPQLYSELVNAINNDNNKDKNNTITTVHVFAVLRKAKIKNISLVRKSQ